MSSAGTSFPVRRPRLTLVLALIATLLSVAFILRLRPETSIQGLLDAGDPGVAALGEILEHYPITSELIVLATVPENTPEPEKTLLAFADRFQQAFATDLEAAALIEAVRYRPSPQFRQYIEKVVVPNGLYYLDDAAFEQAKARLTRAGMDDQLRRSREMFAAPGPAAGELGKVIIKDPLRLHEFMFAQLSQMIPAGGSADLTGGGAFFSSDHRSLLLRIAGRKPPSDLAFCQHITSTTARLLEQANADHLTFETTGAYAIAAHSAQSIRRDSIESVNVSVIGLIVLFWIIHRRPIRWFFLAFLPMAIGIAWGFGAYAALRPTITPLAAVIGGALGGIGVDYFVFVLSNHGARRESVDTLLKRLRGPLSAAFVTSVIGFAVVAWSPIRILRDFALLGSLSLLGAFIGAVTVLPALLTLLQGTRFDRSRFSSTGLSSAPTPLPLPLSLGKRTRRRGPITRFLTRFIARHAVAVGITSAAGVTTLLLLTLVFGQAPTPDDSMTVLHPQPNPPLAAQQSIAARMGLPPGNIQLLLHAENPTALLSLAHDVDRRLRSSTLTEAGLRSTLNPAGFLPDPARAARRAVNMDPALSARVETDLTAALNDAGFNPTAFKPYLTFLHRLLTPQPAPTLADLQQYPEVAQLTLPRTALNGQPATQAVCQLFFSNLLDRRPQREAALNALHAALADLPDVTIAGMADINRGVEAAVYRDLPKLFLTALGLIAFYHLIHFRKLAPALLALVPTLVSFATLIAFVFLTHQPLNLINMVMIPLLLGIDIDYGILTVSAWLANPSRRQLLRAFPTNAIAVLTCGLATVIGFGSLVTVSIPAVRSLGWLINVGVLSCVLGTFVILWPLLLLRRPK